MRVQNKYIVILKLCMAEENKSRAYVEKYKWNKELFHWRNKQKWLDK